MDPEVKYLYHGFRWFYPQIGPLAIEKRKGRFLQNPLESFEAAVEWADPSTRSSRKAGGLGRALGRPLLIQLAHIWVEVISFKKFRSVSEPQPQAIRSKGNDPV